MSEQMPQAPQVGPREAMNQQIDSARAATQALDQMQASRVGNNYHNLGRQGELMQVGNGVYGPSVETAGRRADPQHRRVDARFDSNTGVEYHAYDDPNGTTRAKVSLADGRERTITNPKTVQKIIGKIASQVERRANDRAEKFEKAA